MATNKKELSMEDFVMDLILLEVDQKNSYMLYFVLFIIILCVIVTIIYYTF